MRYGRNPGFPLLIVMYCAIGNAWLPIMLLPNGKREMAVTETINE